MLRRTICNLDSVNQSIFLNAREAAAQLGVKLDTLYAYVSRGLLRSIAVPGSRERRYRREDVDAFRGARGGGSAVQESTAGAAMPVIDSAICLIEGGRLYYRGQDAIRLSDGAALEDIAELLWDSKFGSMQAGEGRARRGGGRGGVGAATGLGLIERC